jgi:EmrB/QacA subfamily drug resistance transporter
MSTATSTPTTGSSPARPHLRATLILCCVAQFMVILDVSVVNVALPSIRHSLGFTEANLQWVVNAYTVTFAGFLLLGGRAADLIGRRRVFVSGLTLFALASLAGGLSDDQTLLTVARAIQGLGGAIVAPASLSILTTTFTDPAERNRAVGIWGAMGGAGGAAGALLGGILIQALSWRWILFINVPIGRVAALATQRLVAEGRNPERARGFDLAGAVSATAGLSLLVLGIVRTDTTGWGAASTIGLLAGGVALLVAFVAIEGRFARSPLMPLRVFRSRTLSAANLVVLLSGGASFAMWFFLTLYLQQVLGYSPLKAGLAFLPMTMFFVLGSVVASRLVIKVGPKRLLVAGMLLASAGLLLFGQIRAGGHFYSDVLGPSLLCTFGMACAFVPAAIAAVSGAEPHESGLASGLVNTSRMFGGALGLAVLAAIGTSRTDSLLHGGAPMAQALTSGFRLSFDTASGIAFVGALVAAFALPRVRIRARDGAPAAAPAAAPAQPEPVA